MNFISKRVVLAYFLSGLVVIILFCAPLWYAWRTNIETGRLEIMVADADRMALAFARRGVDGLAELVGDRVGTELGRHVLLLTDPAGKKLAGNLDVPPDRVPGAHAIYTSEVEREGKRVFFQLIYRDLPGGYRLWVGRDVTRFENLEMLFTVGVVGSGVLVMIFAGLAGWHMRRSMLRSIAEVNRTTAAIMEGHLSERLPVTNVTNEEFRLLAKTLNRMFEQIEYLVGSVKQSTNAIAHDLRTPLAELRTRLEELSVMRPAPVATFGEIDASIADVDRIITIFNAILRLAEINRGTRRAGFEVFDLKPIIEDVIEFYSPVAELESISLSAGPMTTLPMRGDALLISQALNNLVDNALKFSEPHGAVSIQAHLYEGVITIVVADNGPGLPDSEKGKVLGQFYRADRSSGKPGTGLGLALVDSVVRLHAGSIALEDNHPGLRVRLQFEASRGFPASVSWKRRRSSLSPPSF